MRSWYGGRGCALGLGMSGLILLSLGGCNDTPLPSAGGPPAGEQAMFTIAVIPKGTTHEFWTTVEAGVRAAEKDLGVKVVWQGPVQESDRNQQIRIVEDLVARRVSAICLAPLDAQALVPAVRQANAGGVPVVIFDSDLSGGERVSFVATDNRAAGRLGAQHLASLLPQGGNVVLLRYMEGSASTTEREEGFLEEMGRHPGIVLISTDRYAGATSNTAQQAAEQLLQALQQQSVRVDGIFCPNESSTFGMLLAMVQRGSDYRPMFVGFDTSRALLDALGRRQIDGLVAQDPYRMGYLAVEAAANHLRGLPLQPRVDTGAVLITPDNLSSPRIRELLRQSEAGDAAPVRPAGTPDAQAVPAAGR